MNSSNLEAWADAQAAHNKRPFDWITPVLLYRNGRPALMGAYVLMEGGKEVILTAAHGFSVNYPSFVWSFRKLTATTKTIRPIVKVAPMRGADDDVAICTPASLAQLEGEPISNFYSEPKYLASVKIEPGNDLSGTVRSVLSGDDFQLLGELKIEGKLNVGFDFKASEGQSGSVFVDEANSRLYILRAYSPQLSKALHEGINTKLSLKHGIAFALRLAYA